MVLLVSKMSLMPNKNMYLEPNTKMSYTFLEANEQQYLIKQWSHWKFSSEMLQKKKLGALYHRCRHSLNTVDSKDPI